MVIHNETNQDVFSCSLTYKGQNLDELLLPDPTSVHLSWVPPDVRILLLWGILGISHQVRLLPENQPLLYFLWCDMRRIPNLWCRSGCLSLSVPHVMPQMLFGGMGLEMVIVSPSRSTVNVNIEANDVINKMRELLMDGDSELCQQDLNDWLT